MKIKMLPNWCKKLGLIVFLLGFIISAFKGFMEGFTASAPNTVKYDFFENNLSSSTLHFFDVLSVVGMVIYMFSKEKIEDDFINKLRLESFQLTFLMALVISILLYMVSQSFSLKLDYFINLSLMFYLLAFAVKKRSY